MPDHPQHTVVEPCGAFRESLLRFIERQELHDAFRQFGDLLQTLILEAPRFLVSPTKRGEEPIAGTSTQHEVKAILLDLIAVRTDIWGVREGMGHGEGQEAARLAIAVADLLPALDEMIGTLRLACVRAAGASAPAGSPPLITSEMVRDALNDDGGGDGA